MTKEILQIKASTGDDVFTEGTITIHTFTKNEKYRKAAKKLASFWALAIFSVFIPVAHFFLVPLFLIIGLVLFFKVMKTTGEVLEGRVQCPSCKNEVTIGKDYLEWPLKEICQSCVHVLRIPNPKEA